MSMVRFLFFSYLCALFFMVIIMGLSLHSVVPLDIALGLHNLKELILAALLVILSALWVLTGVRLNVMFGLVSAAYPVYYLVVGGLRKENFSWVTLILLSIWFFFPCVLSQYWLRSDRYKWVVGVFGLALTVLLVWGFVSYSIYGASIDTFSHRLAFGFENPNLYAQIPFVMLICAAWLLTDSGPKVRYYVIVALGLIAVALSAGAVSRSGIMGALVFSVVYLVRDIRLRLLLAVLFILSIWFALSVIDSVDSVSSGRLTMWDYFVGRTLEQGFSTFFFGAFENPVLADAAPMYSRLNEASDSASRLFRADNVYVQIWVEGGIFGLLIFIMYWAYLFSSSSRLPAKLKVVWEATVVSSLVQGMFISNMFAFYAPVPLFLMMTLALPVCVRPLCSRLGKATR